MDIISLGVSASLYAPSQTLEPPNRGLERRERTCRTRDEYDPHLAFNPKPKTLNPRAYCINQEPETRRRRFLKLTHAGISQNRGP